MTIEWEVHKTENANPKVEPKYFFAVRHNPSGSWVNLFRTESLEEIEKYVENWKRLGGESNSTTIMKGSV